MVNSFIVNYNLQILTLKYNGEYYSFNLNDDVGDYWNTFEDMDINFYQESENDEPKVSLYHIINNGADIKNPISIKLDKKVGEMKYYFK